MKRRILPALLVVVLGAPLPVAADLHTVEIVVFARLHQNTGQGELLGENLRPLDPRAAVRPEDALAASRAATPSAPHRETSAVAGSAPARAPRLLQQQARLLEQSADYRVLYHNAWVQEIASRSNSIAVRIRDVRIEPGAADAGAAGLRAGELDGTVRVYRGRYYQADVAVEYRPRGAFARPPDPYAAPRAYPETTAPYVLEDRRRIRTGETHYFDHPRFGVLLRVDRLASGSGTP